MLEHITTPPSFAEAFVAAMYVWMFEIARVANAPLTGIEVLFLWLILTKVLAVITSLLQKYVFEPYSHKSNLPFADSRHRHAEPGGDHDPLP